MQNSHENTIKNPENITWQITSSLPTLKSNDIHVWCLDLDALVDQTPLVTLDELQNANQMRFSHLRQRTINARGFLRYLLGHYLQQTPLTIKLATAQYGKPYLESDVPLLFNLAHSHNMAVYAFNYHDAIGIDIEKENNLTDIDAIAQTVFSPIELCYIRSSKNQVTLLERFYILWSRKEAVIKVTGDGLNASLQTITTTLTDGDINTQRDYAPNFQLQDLPKINGFQGAISGELKQKDICYFKKTNLSN